MSGIEIGRFSLAALLVLLAPGGALLTWLFSDSTPGSAKHGGLLSWLADAVALSIAIPALLGLGFYLAGVRVGPAVVIGLYGLCLALLVAAVLKRRIHFLSPRKNLAGWVGGLFSLLFLAGLLAWRLYQARALALPAWVDSVHHTLIVRKIFEYGGLPPDLSPYLPIPLFYHYAFHLITALFVFWSGTTPDQAVLWFGQILNAAVALSVFRAAEGFTASANSIPAGDPAGDPAENCAKESTKQPELGIWLRRAVPYMAALLVTFDFQMPAYYLTWGRYTLLSGLILLGPTLAAVLELRDRPMQWRPAGVMLALLIAGLCVTHYFALLLAGLFLAVVGGFSAIQGFRSRLYWKALVWLAAFTILGIALASPWLWRVWQYNQQRASIQVISPIDLDGVSQKNTAEYWKYLIYLIGPRRNYLLMGMAGVGALAALLRPRLRPLVAWGLLLGALSLPWGLRLGPFRPDHFSIVLFFPAVLLLAELLVAGADALGKRARPITRPWPLTGPWGGPAALAAVAVLFLAWGSGDTRNILNSGTVFAYPADVKALEWIKGHTPPDARFYINSTLWQGQIYRGTDGGYWILPYTERFNLVPPALYGWAPATYILQVSQWAKQSAGLKGCTPDFWNLVREARLTYVYIRQGKGSLQPGMLADCPRLRLVYQQAGVFIYEINPR